MKKIYKINFLAIITVLFFNSCAVDDDPATTAVINNISVSLDQSGEIVVDLAETEYDVNVLLSQALTTDTEVEYTLNGVATTQTFEAGMTSIPLIFTNGIGVINELTITDARGLYNNVIVGADNSVTFLGLPPASPTSIEAVAANDTGTDSFWFGLSSFTSGGTWVADYNQNSTNGHPRPMSIPLDGIGNLGLIPNSADIEPNFLALNMFTQGTVPDPTGFTIYLVMPDGSYESFSGTVPATLFADNPVVKVDVTTDATSGDKNYVFSAL